MMRERTAARIHVEPPGRARYDLPPGWAARRRTVVFRGDLRSTMGYSYETRALAGLLPEDYDVFGVDLHYNPRDGREAFPGELISDEDVLQLCAIHDRQVSVVNNTSPEGYVYFPGAVNIGAFYWETDAIAYGLDWPELIAAMDFHWAKSSFQLDLFRRCGVSQPVPVVTWPFDFEQVHAPRPGLLADLPVNYVERFHPEASSVSRRAAGVARVDEPLLLSVSSMAPRKGLPILLSEWRDYVGQGGEGVLLLKLRPIHNHRLREDEAPAMADLLAEAGFRAGDDVRVAYTFADLEAAELRELYRLCDGYVTASYGEGFGGPVVEALMLDRPVIAPRHSSLADLLPEGYPLEVETLRRHVGLAGNSPIYPHASSWGLPVRGSLVRAFQRFAQMSEQVRSQVAAEARAHAQGFCSREVVAAELLRFFDGLEMR